MFQKEKDAKTGRLHYQGPFKLKGPRIGKKQLLKEFSRLGCVSNLTFEPEKALDSKAYFTKLQTRVEGSWFIGKLKKNSTLGRYITTFL